MFNFPGLPKRYNIFRRTGFLEFYEDIDQEVKQSLLEMAGWGLVNNSKNLARDFYLLARLEKALNSIFQFLAMPVTMAYVKGWDSSNAMLYGIHASGKSYVRVNLAANPTIAFQLDDSLWASTKNQAGMALSTDLTDASMKDYPVQHLTTDYAGMYRLLIGLGTWKDITRSEWKFRNERESEVKNCSQTKVFLRNHAPIHRIYFSKAQLDCIIHLLEICHPFLFSKSTLAMFPEIDAQLNLYFKQVYEHVLVYIFRNTNHYYYFLRDPVFRIKPFFITLPEGPLWKQGHIGHFNVIPAIFNLGCF